MTDAKYDLFFSYSREDIQFTLALAELLRKSNIAVWLDQWELAPGQNFFDVESVIKQSRAIAVCVGRRGLGAQSKRELELAQSDGLRCVPILLPSAAELPPELRAYQALDLRDGSNEQLGLALQNLVRVLADSPSSVPSAATPAAESATPKPPESRPGPESDQSLQKRAKDILRGQHAGVQEIADLARQLKARRQFGYARQLLALARQNSAAIPASLRVTLGQQQALCTYKDTHLPVDLRFDEALRILKEADDLLITANQETLGLAGAICKYKWEALGQKADLERSATYYLRGRNAGVTNDLGYTAINAAFVLDQLALQESEQAQQAGAASATAEQRRLEARQIREELVSALPPLANNSAAGLNRDWWFLVTVAEAYFGLEQYQDAIAWIERARMTNPDSWQLESTLRQFATIEHIRAAVTSRLSENPETSQAWRVLVAIAGEEKAAGIRTVLIGKVGLALSGGGFRASFYHIGVLAKLAELDALRYVEVISCVSGGSIVGAYYYLELQRLLQEKQDAEITREDYIAIVRRMQREFLKGVQSNIRTRIIANFWVSLKLAFWPGYSRTERAGELYEQKLYSRIDGRQKRSMQDLLIRPKSGPDDFTPSTHNWTRRAKVPALVLNATSLNTGHNWQFTATYMGEPPSGIDSEVDGNYRLRRMYYHEAPPKFRHVPLGLAVGASACVPALFEPVTLSGLYEGKQVRLVDGGVQDNQGVSALLDEACSVMLVSDASGQMDAQDSPGTGPLPTLLRASSIQGARVREAEFEDLSTRRRSSVLRGLMFVHLKKGLDSPPVDWIGCEDPAEVTPPAGDLTPYGILKNVQERLSAIRTDLDSFNDVESYALMTSGYRMVEYEFARTIRGFPSVEATAIAWPFLEVEPPMKYVADRAKHEDLMQLLTAAHSSAFKIWTLSPALHIIGWLLTVAAIVGTLSLAYLGPTIGWTLTLRMVVGFAVVTAIGAVVSKTIVRVVRFRDTLLQIVTGIGLCVVGWLLGGIHLAIFDKLYLRRGKVDTFTGSG